MTEYWEDWEEPYYEPTEADEIFLEASGKLWEALRSNVKSKLESVKRENDKLKRRNEELHDLVVSWRSKERELVEREKEIERKAKRLPLSGLMGDREFVMWEVDRYNYRKKEKCDKCNEERKIPYKSPLGKQMFEDCECSRRHNHYQPKQKVLHALRKRKNDPALYIWFRSKDEEDMYNSELVESTSDDEDFSDLSVYNAVFADKEKCQAYCDWLNGDGALGANNG